MYLKKYETHAYKEKYLKLIFLVSIIIDINTNSIFIASRINSYKTKASVTTNTYRNNTLNFQDSIEEQTNLHNIEKKNNAAANEYNDKINSLNFKLSEKSEHEKYNRNERKFSATRLLDDDQILCDSSCEICEESSSKCYKCKDDYYSIKEINDLLSENRFICKSTSSIPNCLTELSGKCLLCENNFVLSKNFLCLECSKAYENCSACSNNDCVTCSSNNELLINKVNTPNEIDIDYIGNNSITSYNNISTTESSYNTTSLLNNSTITNQKILIYKNTYTSCENCLSLYRSCSNCKFNNSNLSISSSPLNTCVLCSKFYSYNQITDSCVKDDSCYMIIGSSCLSESTFFLIIFVIAFFFFLAVFYLLIMYIRGSKNLGRSNTNHDDNYQDRNDQYGNKRFGAVDYNIKASHYGMCSICAGWFYHAKEDLVKKKSDDKNGEEKEVSKDAINKENEALCIINNNKHNKSRNSNNSNIKDKNTSSNSYIKERNIRYDRKLFCGGYCCLECYSCFDQRLSKGYYSKCNQCDRFILGYDDDENNNIDKNIDTNKNEIEEANQRENKVNKDKASNNPSDTNNNELNIINKNELTNEQINHNIYIKDNNHNDDYYTNNNNTKDDKDNKNKEDNKNKPRLRFKELFHNIKKNKDTILEDIKQTYTHRNFKLKNHDLSIYNDNDNDNKDNKSFNNINKECNFNKLNKVPYATNATNNNDNYALSKAFHHQNNNTIFSYNAYNSSKEILYNANNTREKGDINTDYNCISNTESISVCVICQDTFPECILPCKNRPHHKVHKLCFAGLMNTKFRKCPICRSEFSFEDSCKK